MTGEYNMNIFSKWIRKRKDKEILKVEEYLNKMLGTGKLNVERWACLNENGAYEQIEVKSVEEMSNDENKRYVLVEGYYTWGVQDMGSGYSEEHHNRVCFYLEPSSEGYRLMTVGDV